RQIRAKCRAQFYRRQRAHPNLCPDRAGAICILRMIESTRKITAIDSHRPGSTPVSGVGESVSLSRTCPEVEQIHYAKRLLPHFERPWALTISTRARRLLSQKARPIVLNALLHFNCDRYELFSA